jgi:hypothetical protein
LALFHGQVSGQVFKRVIRGEGLERIIPYHIPKEDNPILRLPQLYIDSVLQQDVQNGNTKYRFGVGHRLNFTKSDGAVSQISSYTIWKNGMIDIRILKAISDDEFEKSTTYRIFDPNGTLMMQGKASGQIFQIDVSSLKNNVYLLEVQTSKSVSREKILIIH